MTYTPRDAETQYQERLDLVFPFAQQTTSFNLKMLTCDKPFDLESVEILDVTGLAIDTSNFYVLSVKDAATVMTSLSTHDTALTANTFINTANVAGATRAAAGDVLSLDGVLTGTKTLPAGLIHLRGHWR